MILVLILVDNLLEQRDNFNINFNANVKKLFPKLIIKCN